MDDVVRLLPKDGDHAIEKCQRGGQLTVPDYIQRAQEGSRVPPEMTREQRDCSYDSRREADGHRRIERSLKELVSFDVSMDAVKVARAIGEDVNFMPPPNKPNGLVQDERR